MFWEKKEDKKGLPELPPMKVSFKPLKEEEEEAIEKSELPELPKSQEMPSETAETYDLHPKFRHRRIQMEKEEPSKEDVYVKIDKFHSARKSLNLARTKLDEIDEVMRKIRETRMREEQELASWEKDIDSVKTKVEDVTKNIFEKVE